jgi:hypothetical protein
VLTSVFDASFFFSMRRLASATSNTSILAPLFIRCDFLLIYGTKDGSSCSNGFLTQTSDSPSPLC